MEKRCGALLRTAILAFVLAGTLAAVRPAAAQQSSEIVGFVGRRQALFVTWGSGYGSSDTVVTVKAANDTSDWIPLGRYHFFNLYFDLDPASGQTWFASADSLPNFEVRYELWHGGVAEEPGANAGPYWEKGQTKAMVLMDYNNTGNDTLNGGRFYQDFHVPASKAVSPTAWIRFVLAPDATNDTTPGYRGKMRLLRQP